MTGDMKYRLRVAELSTAHMSNYADAVEQAKAINDNRGFYHFCGLHGAPGRWCWHHQFSRQSNLSGRIFLPWHRAYLHRLEQALQDVNEDAAIPWWDWTQGPVIPTAFDQQDFDGRENPLWRSHIRLSPPQLPGMVDEFTQRNPGPSLPVYSFPAADVNQDGRATLGEIVNFLISRVTRFEEFNDLLETIHDHLHGHVGGHMANQTFAAFDPIFYSHHCMIDRVWALWQREHGTDNYPSALKDIVLEPFGLTVREVLNVEELGYDYANSLVDIPVTGTDAEG